MQAECLRKDYPNKLYLQKQMGEDQLDDVELDGPITLRILDGIAWGFAQAKWWIWSKAVDEVWWLNLELLPRNPHGKAGNEERSIWPTHFLQGRAKML